MGRAAIASATIRWATLVAAVLGAPRNRAQHPAEHDGVDRKERIPVDQPRQSDWLEHGGLMDDGATGNRLDVELEPGTARQFHFRRKPQASARFVCLDTPEVEGVSDRRGIRVAPPAAHSDATHQQVDCAPDSPQPRAEIPAPLTPDPGDGSKRAVRVDGYLDLASLEQLATESRVGRRRGAC